MRYQHSANLLRFHFIFSMDDCSFQLTVTQAVMGRQKLNLNFSGCMEFVLATLPRYLCYNFDVGMCTTSNIFNEVVMVLFQKESVYHFSLGAYKKMVVSTAKSSL